jgi:non-heme chloroperoxidase
VKGSQMADRRARIATGKLPASRIQVDEWEQRLRSGAQLRVRASGSGRPVVLIHGLMMSSRFFSRQLDDPPAGCRLIAPDLRGHGDSERSLSGHTMEQYAADLLELCGPRNSIAPVLVGWSMGAMVAFEYMKLSRPGEVAGLVIIDQPPAPVERPGYDFGTYSLERIGYVIRRLQTDLGPFAREFLDAMLHLPPTAGDLWMVDEIMKVPPCVAATAFVDHIVRDYRDFLAEVKIPTLVAFGGDSKLIPAGAARYIGDLIEHSRVEVFDLSSHCPFYEEPSRFNQILGEFVNELCAVS